MFYTLLSRVAIVALACLMAATSTSQALGENEGAVDINLPIPNAALNVNNSGKIALTITNYGNFGTGLWQAFSGNSPVDPETSLPAPSCEYPKGSSKEYLFNGAIWIGGIIGNDTLVSVGDEGWNLVAEIFPDPPPGGGIVRRLPGEPGAVSDKDFMAVFTDTLTTGYATPDPYAGPHRPLHIAVTQNSYSWADTAREDFVVFECRIKNVGSLAIHDGWVGIFVDGDVWHWNTSSGFADDLAGYLESERVAYVIDNDGDPGTGAWNATRSVRGAIGVKFLGSNQPMDGFSFNWWIANANPAFNWGPQRTPGIMNYSGSYGVPEGNVPKYEYMSGNEIDYDQIWAAIDHTAQGWIPYPNLTLARQIADGYDTRFLYSFGPFNLQPDSVLRFVYAVIMGDQVHVDPADFGTYFNSANPQPYYDRLDFADLIDNATVAQCIADHLDCRHGGDCNDDGVVTGIDLVFLIQYAFMGGNPPRGDTFCPAVNRGDFNCDGRVNLIDVVTLVNYIYRQPAPGPCDPCPR